MLLQLMCTGITNPTAAHTERSIWLFCGQQRIRSLVDPLIHFCHVFAMGNCYHHLQIFRCPLIIKSFYTLRVAQSGYLFPTKGQDGQEPHSHFAAGGESRLDLFRTWLEKGQDFAFVELEVTRRNTQSQKAKITEKCMSKRELEQDPRYTPEDVKELIGA